MSAMTRTEGYAFAEALADAGFSCSLNIGVHPKMAPAESCSVAISGVGIGGRLRPILDIADAHGMEATLALGAGLTFFKAAGDPRAL